MKILVTFFAAVLLSVSCISQEQQELNDKLIKATSNDDIEMVKLLIVNGADVNTKSKLGDRTTLMLASGFNRFAAVKLLIENGADVNAKDKDGRTALDFINSTEMRALLIKHGTKHGTRLFQ